jgi:hypothetical protein
VVPAYVCFFGISHLLTEGGDIDVNGGGCHGCYFLIVVEESLLDIKAETFILQKEL